MIAKPALQDKSLVRRERVRRLDEARIFEVAPAMFGAKAEAWIDGDEIAERQPQELAED
ncbi:MAG: hypothetical protein AAFX50_07180 [Acidobacteriota bacterium]